MSENMSVTIVDQQPCSITLSVEIPQTEVAQETEKVYQDIRQAARVPGFRQGKAPLEMIKRNYVSAARERVMENLMQRSAFPALKSQGIEPVDTPVVEETVFDFDKPFVFKMKAERHPRFEVKDYKGIKATREVSPVTDEKVNEMLQSLRERNARLGEAASDTVGPDHLVQVDYECLAGGVAMGEMKTKNQMLDLNSPQAIPGFKEGLAGTKKGETKDIAVTFPADHPNKKLAGTEVVFKVTVVGIKEKILPALDDEFAKDMGLQSLDELKGKVRESMETEEKRREDQAVEKQLIDHLVAANPIPLPESLVREQERSITERAASYFRSQGMPDSFMEKNMGQFKDKYRAEAERGVQVSYILRAVADKENISVADADLDAEKARMLASNPGREQDVEKYFVENRSRIAASMKEEKIFKFILDNAKIKEEVKK